MSVNDFLTGVSIFADIVLIIASARKLHQIPDGHDNRPVVMGLIVGVAMLIMHLTGFADRNNGTPHLRVMCWQLLHLVTEITLIKLVVSIPSKK